MWVINVDLSLKTLEVASSQLIWKHEFHYTLLQTSAFKHKFIDIYGLANLWLDFVLILVYFWVTNNLVCFFTHNLIFDVLALLLNRLKHPDINMLWEIMWLQ